MPQRFVDPAAVTTHMHLREGDIVADFGAGSGYFATALTTAVGESGLVYAVEVQKNLVEKIGDLARSKGLGQLQIIWGDIEEIGGTKIGTEALDAAIMVNTFFQCEDKNAALAEVWRALRSGGKFFIIDWSESFGGLGPQPNEVVSEPEATALCESFGFVLERTFPAGGHHYGIACRKP